MVNKRKRMTMVIIILAVVLALLLAGTGVYFYFFHGLTPGRILENVTIAGVDVGGLSVQEATEALKKRAADTYASQPMMVTVESYQVSIPASAAHATLDTDSAVADAYNYGRKGKYAVRKAQQLTAATVGYTVDIAEHLSVDEENIRTCLEDFLAYFDTSLTQSSYILEGDTPDLTKAIEDIVPQTLILTRGTSRYDLDFEELYQKVLAAYRSTQFQVEFACAVTQPDTLDIESIYKEYCFEAVNAVMDPETFQITPEIYGYDFDLEKAAADFEALPEGKSLEVDFRVNTPEDTYQSLYDSLFQDVLSTYTAVSGSQYGRDINLNIACNTINGTILYPGDEFSYNPALGERTPEKGYMPAASYSGLETVSTYGGGICQVSSSIYYCAVVADLEILQRHNHTFDTGYMPTGTDATVDWSGPNLRFRNNSSYPIRIDAYADGGTTVVTFMGTDDKDYYIKFENVVTEIIYAKEREEEYPPDNPKGYTDGQVISTPYNGCKAVTYRAKYDKETDELISRDWESSSVYSARDRVICKIVDPNVPREPAAEPSAGAITPDQ